MIDDKANEVIGDVSEEETVQKSDYWCYRGTTRLHESARKSKKLWNFNWKLRFLALDRFWPTKA